ncbi:aggregation-promoting factor C-terminal-like domain-containing protein [Bifidobacterium vespertilionis]|uniref:DUF348 domain-containing protein n=1 Tax=Bifidobacterium vespertilionis TaxID=2562524 RepID=A0A5J5DWN1_9BIFI|nr:G5 domain-containing protein [Bifidobacterium vespertilionis]KAA8821092.1 DUF348 domain-containing protein [Bifidobacterium vespertilionis]KAA8821235.1 DUF348 domain-containing protein [Bifidobacterium vespertilionis]
MARRWTPKRFVIRRRIRVAAVVAAVLASSALSFGIGARKTVALDVNGETRTISTYAMSVDRLLQEQGVAVKTHDVVQSTSGTDTINNHDVVTVRSAFQTTVTIDGAQVPFWTIATSADQLLGFFASNEADAAKVTVDIKNVYNQLTGGLIINQNGPVTVIADGKTSVAPDGKLPAASILDSKGITLGKEDRVSVEKDGDQTVLRVQRVTHGQTTKTVAIPHGTQTVIDDSLAPGETVVRIQGEDGEKTETYNTTFVDGVADTETLVSSTVTKLAVDTVIAVGPEKVETPAENGTGSEAAGGDGTTGSPSPSPSASSGSASPSEDPTPSDSATSTSPTPSEKPSTPSTTETTPSTPATPEATQKPSEQPSSPAPSSKPSVSTPTQKPTTGGSSGSGNSGNSGNSGSSSGSNNGSNGSNSGSNNSDTPPTGVSRDELETWYENHNRIPQSEARLWHPTAAQAKAYARANAAQRGWTGDDWTALETLWTKESSWTWSADNPSSSAYGIPQALLGWNMGYGWQDDGAVQIDWGLNYIAQRYGTPSKAWAFWQQKKWY